MRPTNGNFNLATVDSPERVEGEYVTADYFETFGVQPIVGRILYAEEDQPGRAPVVVLSERLWRTRFRASRTLLGETIHINGQPFTVIGVMPNGFDPLLSKTDLWTPAAFTSEQLANHDDHFLSVIGRLRPGVSLAEAQAELNVIAMWLQRQYPADDKDRGLRVTPLSSALFGDQRLALGMLLAAVGFLLLIACANIANLQLSRSRIREKEIALRAALGATSKRVVGQLLTENVVLGLVGGAFGVLLAYWGVKEIVAFGPANVPRLDEAHIDATSLTFACVLAFQLTVWACTSGARVFDTAHRGFQVGGWDIEREPRSRAECLGRWRNCAGVISDGGGGTADSQWIAGIAPRAGVRYQESHCWAHQPFRPKLRRSNSSSTRLRACGRSGQHSARRTSGCLGFARSARWGRKYQWNHRRRESD